MPEQFVQPAWEIDRIQAVESDSYYQSQIALNYQPDIIQQYREGRTEIGSVPISACFMEFRDIIEAPSIDPNRFFQLQEVLLNKIASVEQKKEGERSISDVNRRLIHLSKMIGDSMYAHTVGFNRAVLRWTAQRHETGFITSGEYKKELETARELAANGHIVMLNDLTNYARLGDVTYIDSQKGIQFLEVKSGKSTGRNQRAERQQGELNKTMELFTHNLVTDSKKAEIIDIMEIDVPVEHYRNNLLGPLVEQATNTGYASAQPDKVMQLEVYTQEYANSEKENEAKLPSEGKVTYDSYLHSFFGPLMLTIPIPAWKGFNRETLWKLASGQVRYRTTIDFSAYQEIVKSQSTNFNFIFPEDLLSIHDLRETDSVTSKRKFSTRSKFKVELTDSSTGQPRYELYAVPIGHYGPMFAELVAPSSSANIDIEMAKQIFGKLVQIRTSIADVKAQRPRSDKEIAYRGFVRYLQDEKNWLT